MSVDSYRRALADLERGMDRFQKMVQEYDKSASVMENKLVTAARKAAAEVEPMVQGFLLQNLRNSGLTLGKSKDGSPPLEGIVGGSTLTVLIKGNPDSPAGITLKYQVAAGLPEKAYKKASSVNYGAVRTSRSNRDVIGEKRKRSLKKALWNSTALIRGEPNARKNAWLAKAKIDVTKASFKGKSISVGGFSATRAWKFYKLNDSQIKQVVVAFTVALESNLRTIPD